MKNSNVKKRSNQTRSAKPTKSRKASKPARADRDSHQPAGADDGHFDIKPGMAIADGEGGRKGVAWEVFPDLGLVIYLGEDQEFHFCLSDAVLIDPTPDEREYPFKAKGAELRHQSLRKLAQTDRELEDAITDKLDRESLERLSEGSISMRPIPAAKREQMVGDKNAVQSNGIILDPHAMRDHPSTVNAGTTHAQRVKALGQVRMNRGMVIHDTKGERKGIIVDVFEDLDMVVYRGQDTKRYVCQVADALIDPRPAGGFLFTVDCFPRDYVRREGLKPLDQITGLFIHLSELLSKLRRVTLPVDCREFLHEYPASLRDHAKAMISELHEFHANLIDELINNTDLPEGDRPLRSADELKAAGAAYAA